MKLESGSLQCIAASCMKRLGVQILSECVFTPRNGRHQLLLRRDESFRAAQAAAPNACTSCCDFEAA
jgi:hypothetical protein